MDRFLFRSKFIEYVSWLGYDDLTVAKLFQVSLPTVSRWREGLAWPHMVGREPVIRELERRIHESNENE